MLTAAVFSGALLTETPNNKVLILTRWVLNIIWASNIIVNVVKLAKSEKSVKFSSELGVINRITSFRIKVSQEVYFISRWDVRHRLHTPWSTLWAQVGWDSLMIHLNKPGGQSDLDHLQTVGY